MTTFDLTEAVWGGGGVRSRFFRNENWEIEIGHNTEFGMERGEGRKSKIAITEYKITRVLATGRASVVECRLQTGRTHQIRVHMKHINHPIVGDQVYGSRRMEKGFPEFPRQALHAVRLEIPDVGVFEAPPPKDMNELIENLSSL